MTDFGDPFLQRMQRERAVTNTEVVRQIESKEVLAEDWIQRLERVERLLEQFANSQEFVLPRAFQELVERVFRVVPVTAGNPMALFQVCRRQQFCLQHQVSYAWRILLQGRHQACQQGLSGLVVPPAL